MSSTRNAKTLMYNQENSAAGVMIIIRKTTRNNRPFVAPEGHVISIDSHKAASTIQRSFLVQELGPLKPWELSRRQGKPRVIPCPSPKTCLVTTGVVSPSWRLEP
jgi:hypothetical protein